MFTIFYASQLKKMKIEDRIKRQFKKSSYKTGRTGVFASRVQ